jgi:hypothetical protein
MEQQLTTTEESTESKDKYIRWFVMRPEERAMAKLPLSPDEYQDRFKTSLEEIKSFHLSDSFADDVFKATQRWAKLKVTEMAHLLVENYITSKSARDFETYLKFLDTDKSKPGDTNPFSAQNINFFNLSPQQYEQILKRESKRYTGDSSVSSESGSGQPDEFLSVD